jgi:hypothetical protein
MVVKRRTLGRRTASKGPGLLPDVLLAHGPRGCADARNKIASSPENRLPILRSQRRKPLSQQPAGHGRHGFEVVGHDAGRAPGVKREQQRNVIRLFLHVEELGIPVLAKRLHHGFEPLEHRCIEGFAPVLRYEHQVVAKQKAPGKQPVEATNPF